MWDQQSPRSACAYAQSDQRPCKWLEYSIIANLPTEHHLEFLSLKGGRRGSAESTPAKMSNRWKSHAAAHITFTLLRVSFENSMMSDKLISDGAS